MSYKRDTKNEFFKNIFFSRVIQMVMRIVSPLDFQVQQRKCKLFLHHVNLFYIRGFRSKRLIDLIIRLRVVFPKPVFLDPIV